MKSADRPPEKSRASGPGLPAHTSVLSPEELATATKGPSEGPDPTDGAAKLTPNLTPSSLDGGGNLGTSDRAFGAV
jgi:hypothetical protein